MSVRTNIISKEQTICIRDCWSRNFSYKEYKNYSKRCGLLPVKKSVYTERYNHYEKEMKLYFLRNQYD